MTSNNVDCIPPPIADYPILKGLQHLSLSFNNLKSWSDIEALSLWCPSLTSLATSGNPLVESELSPLNHSIRIIEEILGVAHNQGGDEVRYTRPFIIVRIPTLKLLDSTAVGCPVLRLDANIRSS